MRKSCRKDISNTQVIKKIMSMTHHAILQTQFVLDSKCNEPHFEIRKYLVVIKKKSILFLQIYQRQLSCCCFLYFYGFGVKAVSRGRIAVQTRLSISIK